MHVVSKTRTSLVTTAPRPTPNQDLMPVSTTRPGGVTGDNLPLGYRWLIDRYRLDVPPPRRTVLRTARGTGMVTRTDDTREETCPRRSWPADDDLGHLRFALKHTV